MPQIDGINRSNPSTPGSLRRRSQARSSADSRASGGSGPGPSGLAANVETDKPKKVEEEEEPSASEKQEEVEQQAEGGGSPRKSRRTDEDDKASDEERMDSI